MGMGLAGAYGAASVVDTLQKLEAKRLLDEKIAREMQKEAFTQALQSREAGRSDVLLGLQQTADQRLADLHPGAIAQQGAQLEGTKATTGSTLATTKKTEQETATKGVLDARRLEALGRMPKNIADIYDVGDQPVDPNDPTGAMKQKYDLERDARNNAAAMARTLAGKADRDDRTVQIRYQDASGNDVTQYVTTKEAREMGSLNSPAGQAVQKKRDALKSLISDIQEAERLGKAVNWTWTASGMLATPARWLKSKGNIGSDASNAARLAIDNLAAEKIHERYGGAFTATELGMRAESIPGSQFADNEARIAYMKRQAERLLEALSGKDPRTKDDDPAGLGLELPKNTFGADPGGLGLSPRGGASPTTDPGGLGLPPRRR